MNSTPIMTAGRTAGPFRSRPVDFDHALSLHGPRPGSHEDPAPPRQPVAGILRRPVGVEPYFLTSGAAGAAGTAGGAKTSFAACGNLSALASNRLTCHICVVESVLLNPGIPVMRIPPATFQ